jgi:hypothetical protein
MAQFKQAIEHLAKADEPSIEYSLWVAEGVPEGFKNYNAVNVEDVQQIRELHHHVRYVSSRPYGPNPRSYLYSDVTWH